jgi:hypothetical protein
LSADSTGIVTFLARPINNLHELIRAGVELDPVTTTASRPRK